jgi:hypothetical protein
VNHPLPDNAPEWYVNIKQIEWEPDSRMVMRSAEGVFPMEASYEFEDLAGEGTRVRLRNRGEPTGFNRLVAPLMASAMRRGNQKDLAALKSRLEESSTHGVLNSSSPQLDASSESEAGRR